MPATLVRLVVGAATLAWLVCPLASAAAQQPPDYAWLDDLSLVVLETTDNASLHAALAEIQAQGGRIGIVSPPSLLLGWIPTDVRANLIGTAGIRDIVTHEIGPAKASALGGADAQTQQMLRYFDAVKRGDYQQAMRQTYAKAAPPVPLSTDALTPEPLHELDYLRNLRANGFDLESLRAEGKLVGKAGGSLSIAGNSDRMTGTVTVTLLFVESDGTGADPNTFTWTDPHVQQYIAGVNTGLLWWSQQAETYNDCWVAFFVRYVPPTDSRNHQWREMVLHPSGDVGAMASDVMAKHGYSSGDQFTRVGAFNTAQKATYGTNWAYTGFVAYNPSGPAQLTNGTSAFAYLLGPYTFLLYRSYGWAPDQVFTHESGHIFGACDEYAGSCGCTCSAALLRTESNANCVDCGGGGTCMMKLNDFQLCAHTDDQLGWQDGSPCAPAALPPPVLASASPPAAEQGTQVIVSVSGTGLLHGAFANLGPGVSISNTVVFNSTQLLLTLQVDIGAVPGPRNITVTNRDLQSSTLPNAFQVLGTTRHYVSPTGSNVFPYQTTANAATTLAAAISAASTGDTVLVQSSVITLPSLTLDRGIVLSGGWQSNFTQHDPAGAPTRLVLSSENLSILSGANPSAVEGFIVENGRGGFGNTPLSGHYGGGVSIQSSTTALRHVEVRNNVAAPSSGFGAGGGIYVLNSTITFENVSVHDNLANLGGGMALFAASGSIRNSSVRYNQVAKAVSGGQTTQGAGIYIAGCTNLTLEDVVVEANTGANTGGGALVSNSTSILILGGAIRNHTVNDPNDGALDQGGGLDIVGSALTLDGVEISGNASSLFAGGVHVGGNSTLTMTACRVLSNTAPVYAGVFGTASNLVLQHNLFVANAAGVFGGAVTLQNVPGGEFLGNTLYANSATNGCAGAAFTDSPIDVSNNIVAGSSGIALQCAGTSSPTLSYNLTWNNSGGDYNGCSAGPGALAADPLFVDAPNANFHLALHAPGIDTGRTDASYADPDGSRGDLGLYGSHDFVMEQPDLTQNLSGHVSGGNVVLAWDTNPAADLAAYAVYGSPSAGFTPALATFVQLVPAPATGVDLGPVGANLYFRVCGIDADGYAGGYSNEVAVDGSTDAPGARGVFRVLGAVPNPFNPSTRIDYELERPRLVDLSIYDLAGRLVRRLVHGRQDAGMHSTIWNGLDQSGRAVSSGVYVYRLVSEDRVEKDKLVLLK